jgi:hypothetical protein
MITLCEPKIDRSRHTWRFPLINYTLYKVTFDCEGTSRELTYQTKKKAESCVRALKKGRTPPAPDGITPLCLTTPVSRWPSR